MKILYIIGNGFDLNLGMKTSYKDFYDYYKSIESTNVNVNNLKKNISDNYKNWSDLELALGQYTDELKTLEEFDAAFDDIGEQLAQYLKNEEEKFDFKNIDQIKFFENLVKPENFLPLADKNNILKHKGKHLNEHWYIDIVTLNYTTIIESIIGGAKSIKIGGHLSNTASVTLKSIEHIHGYIDDRMVLGVNDISQLKNQDFHENQDILEQIIKEKCNKSYRHLIDNDFITKINQADIICLFGSSIGDTDNIWWELIAERLLNNIPFIIFSKGEEVIKPRNGNKKNRVERSIREYFLKKSKLNNEEQQYVTPYIYVAINSLMFKNILQE